MSIFWKYINNRLIWAKYYSYENWTGLSWFYLFNYSNLGLSDLDPPELSVL